MENRIKIELKSLIMINSTWNHLQLVSYNFRLFLKQSFIFTINYQTTIDITIYKHTYVIYLVGIKT